MENGPTQINRKRDQPQFSSTKNMWLNLEYREKTKIFEIICNPIGQASNWKENAMDAIVNLPIKRTNKSNNAYIIEFNLLTKVVYQVKRTNFHQQSLYSFNLIAKNLEKFGTCFYVSCLWITCYMPCIAPICLLSLSNSKQYLYL